MEARLESCRMEEQRLPDDSPSGNRWATEIMMRVVSDEVPESLAPGVAERIGNAAVRQFVAETVPPTTGDLDV